MVQEAADVVAHTGRRDTARDWGPIRGTHPGRPTEVAEDLPYQAAPSAFPNRAAPRTSLRGDDNGARR